MGGTNWESTLGCGRSRGFQAGFELLMLLVATIPLLGSQQHFLCCLWTWKLGESQTLLIPGPATHLAITESLCIWGVKVGGTLSVPVSLTHRAAPCGGVGHHIFCFQTSLGGNNQH